ncbi:MAG: 4Fe-4S dicluster domain-containing protein [Clostridia bacterium]|nr:4Fe-4S dicluster domain-containing protein [Clostridia bacterium]
MEKLSPFYDSVEHADGRICCDVYSVCGGWPALDSVSDTTDVLERDTVVFPKFHREKCIGRGRCVISCADGGHQALRFDENRRPVLNGQKCVGCNLCLLVCPNGAISSSRRRVKRN